MKPELQSTNKVLLGPCNYKIECLGKNSTKLSIDERSTEEEIYVIGDLERPLLGRHGAESLNLLTRVNSIAKGGYKAKVKHKYPQLFIGLGRMKAEYTITPCCTIRCISSLVSLTSGSETFLGTVIAYGFGFSCSVMV